MKVLCLTTWTDCENKCLSLECAGHQIIVEQYDNRPYDRQGEIVDFAREKAPDAIVYIGAVEKYHGRPVLQPDTLCRLREVAPTIHLCNDASDEPWWDHLIRYDARGCFSAQVSIDGNFRTPLHGISRGMVRLTPIDVRPFVGPVPWVARFKGARLVGGLGHSHRAETISYLVGDGMLDFHEGPAGRSYADMARLLCSARVAFNHSMRGSGVGGHVKGRVVEAGFAGCCLLELANDATRRWFAPGEDFIEYQDKFEARVLIEALAASGEALNIAERFARKVRRDHHPRVFWTDVFKLAGVTDAAADR